MSNVYKREGATPQEAWNSLIKKINDLVPECPDVKKLEEVKKDHRWKKSDITEVEDKLTELCESNKFDPIDDIWKQAKIDELIKALEEGTCCKCPDENFPMDLSKLPLTNSLLGINSGAAGTIFLREFDLQGLPIFTGNESSYEFILTDVRNELTAAAKALQDAEDALTQAVIDMKPQEIIDELQETVEEKKKDAKLATGVFKRNFWGITRFYSSGVLFGAEFGIIKDEKLLDPQSLHIPDNLGTINLKVPDGHLWTMYAFCQDLSGDCNNDALVTFGANFFDGLGTSTFMFKNWKKLTGPCAPPEPPEEE